MNLCDACETAAWCSKNGCIPVKQPEPAKARMTLGYLLRVFLGLVPGARMTTGGPTGLAVTYPNRWNGPPPMVRPATVLDCRGPAPLKFPEIDPNLLPTKETTA
jgi:hypothetical protein